MIFKLRASTHRDQRTTLFFHIIFGDRDFSNVVVFRNLIHDVQHKFLDDRTQRPRADFLFLRLLCDRIKRVILKGELHFVERKQFSVLL